MSLPNLINQFCQELDNIGAASRIPQFIAYNEAYYRVKKRYVHNDIGGFLFSLDIIREFIDEIDSYNAALPVNDIREITSIRAWKAVSDFDQAHKCLDDLLLVPVRSDGDDSHAHNETIPTYSKDPTKMLMLGSLRPCPNLCGQKKYFFLHDPSGDGFPNPNNSPYKNCQFPARQEIGDDFNEFSFIE